VHGLWWAVNLMLLAGYSNELFSSNTTRLRLSFKICTVYRAWRDITNARDVTPQMLTWHRKCWRDTANADVTPQMLTNARDVTPQMLIRLRNCSLEIIRSKLCPGTSPMKSIFGWNSRSTAAFISIHAGVLACSSTSCWVASQAPSWFSSPSNAIQSTITSRTVWSWWRSWSLSQVVWWSIFLDKTLFHKFWSFTIKESGVLCRFFSWS